MNRITSGRQSSYDMSFWVELADLTYKSMALDLTCTVSMTISISLTRAEPTHNSTLFIAVSLGLSSLEDGLDFNPKSRSRHKNLQHIYLEGSFSKGADHRAI